MYMIYDADTQKVQMFFKIRFSAVADTKRGEMFDPKVLSTYFCYLPLTLLPAMSGGV